jgi:DDE superfamily endonuclease
MAVPTRWTTGCCRCLARPRPTSRRSRRTSSTASAPCCGSGPPRPTSASAPGWPACSPTSRRCRTPRPRPFASCGPSPSASGAAAGPGATSPSPTAPAGAASPRFPPLDRAVVQALACELVHETGRPLSRQSLADLAARARHALGQPISRATVGRVLRAAALKPWRYDHWIFPRDPQFAAKAAVLLDLYAGRWQGEPLGDDDYVLSADEKTSIQARVRCHPTLRPGPGRPRRVEHEYARGGALQYLAAWDVRRGVVRGRCEARTGIKPFGRLVRQVMGQEPYRSARRVFWVVDNGSSHRGAAAVRRLRAIRRKAILVHTPVHASWLNQVEIYFAKVQRKVLTPNDFADLKEVEQRLRLYEELTNRTPRPFAWEFTTDELHRFLQRLAAKSSQPVTHL